MSDDFLKDNNDKELDPADLKKKSTFDLLEEEDEESEFKLADDMEEEEEDEGLSFYDADDSSEIYSF